VTITVSSVAALGAFCAIAGVNSKNGEMAVDAKSNLMALFEFGFFILFPCDE
jgi:hypothetical protein